MIFSLTITPFLDRDVVSGSVDAGFILALPFHHKDLESDSVGVSMRGGGGVGAEHRTRGGEMLLMLVVGLRASPLRTEKAGRFHEVAGMSIVAVGGPRSW